MIAKLNVLAAILAITALGIVALIKGIDSGLLVTVTAAIAGLGGYAITKISKTKE